MRLWVRMSAGSFFVSLLAVAWMGRVNSQPTRCLALCLRSETEDSCQRCRLRVPMRFGKRMDNNGRLRIPMRFGKRRDNAEEVAETLELVAPPILETRRSPPIEPLTLRDRHSLNSNLDIPENWFFRVLNEPSLAYDNDARNDYDSMDTGEAVN